ncbi:glutamate synthase-related protein, partial [Staphylococcus sp. EG-SA-26]|uniref:glutamate synthase-related protein n=1 Tax=Staphylococcus sp. EG-SA-26 TaxID=2767498 RepID=UPI001F1213BC
IVGQSGMSYGALGKNAITALSKGLAKAGTWMNTGEGGLSEYQSFNTPHQVLYTGNSGTTTRLLAGLLSGLGIESVLSGDVSI